jgi:hypothetical protein
MKKNPFSALCAIMIGSHFVTCHLSQNEDLATTAVCLGPNGSGEKLEGGKV